MIKYYDTLAAYEADVKSNFESQVSLIGADNTVKYDGRNVVIDIRSARTGTIAVLDGTHALRFISVDTFSSESFMSNFEIVGIVVVGVDHPSFRGQIAIMYPTPESHPIATIYQWKLTGYTLDGTDRTGTLSIRQASDNWAANHDYVISYNANNESELVNQLNAYFRANEPFKTQGWSAYIDEDNTTNLPAGASGSGVINLVHYCDAFNQHVYNKGKDGFTLADNLLLDWIFTSNALNMNGNRGSSVICNLTRTIAYFRNDNPNTQYNPTVDITSIKRSAPICLPAYLGTSQYQSDHCAYLRSIYGEGEEGWLKFMQSLLPLRPTEYGVIGDKAKYGDARRNTYYLASRKYIDVDGNTNPVSPAADYAANIGFDHELLKKGQWVMPDVDLLFDVIGGIKYPTINDRNADVISRTLLAIGAPALRNDSYYPSCSRSGKILDWYYVGNLGTVGQNSILGNSFPTITLALLDVPQGLNLNK